MNVGKAAKIDSQQGLARQPIRARARSWDRGALLIIALFVLLLPLSTPRIYATDEVQYFSYLRSLYFDGDLDFRDEYTYFAEQGLTNGDPAVFNALLRDKPEDPPVNPRTGLLRNVAPIGSALMWAPGYVLADLGVILARAAGASVPRDGYSWPYIWAVSLMSALYALLGLLLTYRLARRYAGPFAAALATITLWLATPLVFYTYILMPWSHATGFFLFALFLTVWLGPGAERQTPNVQRSALRWAALGLVGALMTLTREQLGLLLVIPAAEGLVAYARLLWGRRWAEIGRLALGHAAFVAVFLLAITPQLAVYQTLYGEPQPSATVSGKLKRCSPHLFDTLVDLDPAPDAHQAACGQAVEALHRVVGRQFDSNAWYFLPGQDNLGLKPLSHGALLWSPVLVPALLGLVVLGRRQPGLAALLALGLLAQIYINGTISTWHLTGSFGFRRLIEVTPIFVIGLATLIAPLRSGWRRWLAIGLAAGLIYWNVGLIAQWTVVRSPERDLRQGLVWEGMLRYQLVEVPRAVLDKADDLLFNRCSLVQNCDDQ